MAKIIYRDPRTGDEVGEGFGEPWIKAEKGDLAGCLQLGDCLKLLLELELLGYQLLASMAEVGLSMSAPKNPTRPSHEYEWRIMNR